MAVTAIERPVFNFTMLGVNPYALRLATSEVQRTFGLENYDEFKRAGKLGQDISAETRLRVDKEMYAKVAHLFGSEKYGGKRVWHEAMLLANASVNRAYGILFPDQDKRASLTTDIAWSDNRPSTALEILTTPTRLISAQLKYEQGRQLGFAFAGAEVLVENGNGEAREVLTILNAFFEEHLFLGKRGTTDSHIVYSYHTPQTNNIEGLSSSHPDSRFPVDSWVKFLDFPVRQLAIRNANGDIEATVHVLYDPREKDREAMVIKAINRSLNTSAKKANGGLIEASPYMEDRLGFRLVLMQGGQELRDRVTAYVEELFTKFEGIDYMEPDDEVDGQPGDPNRIQFKRRKIHLKGLKNPIEMQVFTLEDWLKQEYEVGEFDVQKNMHDGLAHDLHALDKVAAIAGHAWPYNLHGIDHAVAQRTTSYEIATRLGRKQRIHPAPYPDATTTYLPITPNGHIRTPE